MIRTSRSFRKNLLLGASLGSLVLGGVALAQNFGGRGNSGANPGAAAAQAAQSAAQRSAAAQAAAQRTRATLENVARIRSQASAAQAAARAAALAAQSQVPNGIGNGGLKVADGVALDPELWVGASGPTQSQGSDGRTKVNVDQTAAQAILSWDSFNVGRETDLTFDHHGNTNWVTLNRVVGNSADPSQILGSLKADGSIYIINQNGVIFGGASKVNVRNLIAASANITNEHFREYGIYAREVGGGGAGSIPALTNSFTGAAGKVKVEAGAQITTSLPKSVVETGGFVMLLGTEVENAGTIVTDRGQTTLAAGNSFTIRRGLGADINPGSTTRGNEIAVNVDAGSTAGLAVNTGVIEARQGDITIAGEDVVQGGVAISTTNVHTRGTIHLLTNVGNGLANDKQGTSVTLTKDSLTLILPELESKDTATDAQRNSLVTGTPAAHWRLNNQGHGNYDFRHPDRRDRSRIEIMTGGDVTFESGSHTIAQGGQIAVFGRGKTFVGEGAVLDVSGVRGVAMDMASNSLMVNVQPYEMRDSSVNRENEPLKHNNVWIDVRELILLPSGTGGHDGDRYYTPGGLLEVGGHLGNRPHKIGEWVSEGGTINFASHSSFVNVSNNQNFGQLIIQKGATLDVSGGSLDYAAGMMTSTLMLGSDGKYYTAGQAPAGVKMMAVGASFMREHGRWGVQYTETYSNPFSRTTAQRWEEGYTVGRDAGSISLSVPTVLMEGTIIADVVVGDRQTAARPDLPITVGETGLVNGFLNPRIDGYKLPQNVTPLGGSLYVGNELYRPVDNGTRPVFVDTSLTIADGSNATIGMTASTTLAPELIGNVQLSAEAINAAKLGELRVSAETIKVNADIAVANGGSILLYGGELAINGDLTARSGTISTIALPNCPQGGCESIGTRLDVADGVKLDTSGLWVNLKTGGDRRDLPFIKGGDVYMESRQGNLTLGKDSLIDVSAGGAVLETGEMQGARGGDVVLSVGNLVRENANTIELGGDIRAYGSGDFGGGTLIINNGGRAITIGKPLLEGGNLIVAGQPLETNFQLSKDVVLPVGTILPFALATSITKVVAGELAPANIYQDLPMEFTLPNETIVPDGVFIYDMDFNYYEGGAVLPAGFMVYMGWVQLSPGQVVPDLTAFTGSNEIVLPSPILSNIPAGTPLTAPTTLAAGFDLKAGWSLPVDIEVAKPLHLAADFFQKGFTKYDVRAGGDIIVGGTSPIEVSAPVRRFTADSLNVASGARPEDVLELWTPDMFREDPANGRFLQREGASISFTASAIGPARWTNNYGQTVTTPQLFGGFKLDKGTTLQVDDGQAIAVTVADSAYIGGTIEARGGSVTIENTVFDGMDRDRPVATVYDASRALWVDDGATIDVSGRAHMAIDARGLRYAHVSKGGSIRMGGKFVRPPGSNQVARNLTAAYVVVRPGAVLDISGASAEVDYLATGLKGAESRLITTDGGRMAFDSQYGIFLEGSLRAHAGGVGALGGELAVELITPIIAEPGAGGREVPNYMRRLRRVIVDETYVDLLPADLQFGQCVTACWTPGQTIAESTAANEGRADLIASARVSADRIEAGGFDSVSLASDDMVLFNGSVNLSLGRNLLLAGTIGNYDVHGDVELSAAYVNFMRGGTMLGTEIVQGSRGDIALVRAPEIGEGSITITGGLVDLAGINFGANGSIGLIGGEKLEFEYAVSRDINIISRSDIRLTGGTVSSMSNLSLTAAQIYPTTGATATIRAGVYSYRFPGQTTIYTTMLKGSTVNFFKLDGVTPSAPLSLYGTVNVVADIINQGGVLRAPLGTITLGDTSRNLYPGPHQASPGQTWWNSDSIISTREINLLAGSETSVSAAGLTIPYGGTKDGMSWSLNGEVIAGTGTSGLATVASRTGIAIFGSLKADEGAVLDLSGGGTVAGAGFTPGRGGSIDILTNPLATVNPAYAEFSDAGNKVYAIVPAYQNSSAPTAQDGHAQPAFGQQIIVPEGVPGLKAGTYMLLPAEYALMPGAFRVEMGRETKLGAGAMTRMPDGSFAMGLHTSVANLGTRSAMAVDVILTPADVVRTHSQYNEMGYDQFLVTQPDASLFGKPQPFLARDGKTLTIALTDMDGVDPSRSAFSFNGTGKFAAAKDGIGGSLSVIKGNSRNLDKAIEILADGAIASADAFSLYASDLNAVGAAVMLIGGSINRTFTGSTTNITSTLNITPGDQWLTLGASGGDIIVRSGATLAAPQVMLVGNGSNDLIVEQGATLTSVGKGAPAFDSNSGYVISTNATLLAVSNGLLDLSAAAADTSTGRIVVEDGASLYSDGTLAFRTSGPVSLGEEVNYGARYLALASTAINIGTNSALAAAGEQNILPDGILLNQGVLERLMLGDRSTGAPALERLILTATNSVNFYGTVDLDTRANGDSALQLVLNTNSLYGHGSASDIATISADTIVWNGTTRTSGPTWQQVTLPGVPAAVIAGGPGTGSGTLNLNADRIVLGYQDGVTSRSGLAMTRNTLGFANVNLTAAERIESNHQGSISVYQSQADFSKPGTGGNLTMTAPVFTAEGGSKVAFTAGGSMAVKAPEGWTRGATRATAPTGGELHFTGATVDLDALVALPSGVLKLTALSGDMTIGDRAWIDLAGQPTKFFDETRYSWGGDLQIESAAGGVTLEDGSVVDLGAQHNHAGTIKVTALNGLVALNGAINGKALGAGTAIDPALRQGGIQIRAGQLADFAGLNTRLTETGMVESRDFLVKTGDLMIGNEVKARNVSITADGGNLTVNGKIDASGVKPGSIRLAAKGDLTLAATAVLDARGTQLQVDSYGAPIEASNRSTVELTSMAGTLSLLSGAAIDVRSADSVSRGRIELNARRLGSNDVAISAAGTLAIQGAESLSVNAFRTYTPTGGVIDQALLDGIHAESDTFISAALGNGALMGKLAGLRSFTSAFHLRPGVELVSTAGGDLRVSGDLNLAGHRYASLNPNDQRTGNYADPFGGNYGSGEAGVLWIRAADTLDINGSITDGFGMPARTPDDNGWVIYPGSQGIANQPWVQDYRVPTVVRLGVGTVFQGGRALDYAIQVNGFTVNAGTVLNAETTLAQSYTLGQQWVASAEILLPDGSMIAKGTIMESGTVLPSGTKLGKGSMLPMNIALAAMTWPKDLELPTAMTLSAVAQLQAGNLIPRLTNLRLDGTQPMENVRPVQADGTQGRMWAAAQMLKAGSQSWSMRLVAGADLGSADGRALRSVSDLAEAGQAGSMRLSDRHFLNPDAAANPAFSPDYLLQMRDVQQFSVIRTGIGSLDLLAGGSYEQLSLFGVYTAGTPSPDIGGTTPDGYNIYDQPRATLSRPNGITNPYIGAHFDGYTASVLDYQAWYPEHGGDLLLSVQDRMIGYQTGGSAAYPRPGSGNVANWLWRQGGYGVAEGNGAQMGQDIPTAWWIHFGGYVPSNANSFNDGPINSNVPLLTGFMGIGTLGGGNLTVSAGGDAGSLAKWGETSSGSVSEQVWSAFGGGLNFAVASTGRVTAIDRVAGFVTGGDLMQTGGGEMTIRIGGELNSAAPNGSGILNSDNFGTITNLRGNTHLLARSIAGITLTPGDGTTWLDARGNLTLSGVGDPGAITQLTYAGTAFGLLAADGSYSRPDGQMTRSSFTLWQDDTAIHLYSGGGTITPVTMAGGNAARREGRYWYPPILTATAAGGDIRWSAPFESDYTQGGIPVLELHPSALGRIEFLAHGTIASPTEIRRDSAGNFDISMPIAMSGMSTNPDQLPNIFRPVWEGGVLYAQGGSQNRLFGGNAPDAGVGSLFAFQRDNNAGRLIEGYKKPALFYAVTGDIDSMSFGFTFWNLQVPEYVSSGAATFRAGRDIINLGTQPAIGCPSTAPIDCRGVTQTFGSAWHKAGLVVHSDPRDITLISAGRDVIFANMTVAGPGNLIIEAGRNVYQGDRGRLDSIGPLFDLTPDSRNGGAAISIITGVGAGGPNYEGFADAYLDPDNLLVRSPDGQLLPLSHPDNAGRVVKTYAGELTLGQWLREEFGYTGDEAGASAYLAGKESELGRSLRGEYQKAGSIYLVNWLKGRYADFDGTDARDYFDALSSTERGIFLRGVYYEELKLAGREYNEPEGPRFASYLRGRNAIAVLFPEKDAAGNALTYAGDLTMFGGSGARTLFGGGVDLLVAGGRTTLGVGTLPPPATAGLLSMGSGDIDIYSKGSVLLGQSRVFTTFGGDLFIWSAEGDINAGRGAKSTAVFQPPRRLYDNYGIATLSPPTQNTGAGIATLAPIPEIPAGDVDLIAPLGVIDAGEAGIRVSGNVNLAALQVLNAANIQVEGEARGIPLPPVVNTGALTAASAATSAAVAEAVKAAERARPARTDVPVIVSVRLLGFGDQP